METNSLKTYTLAVLIVMAALTLAMAVNAAIEHVAWALGRGL